MSGNGPGELLVQDPAAGEGDVLPVSSVLAMCDRVLREIGRRHHLFAWLRLPAGEGDGWLPVDGYYPRNKLVVVCRETSERHEQLYDEGVPAHGLRMLKVSPGELGPDPAAALATLERMLAGLGLPERKAAVVAEPPPARTRVVAQALSSLLQPPEAPARSQVARPTAPPVSRAPSAVRPSSPAVRPVIAESRTAAAERAARFVATHPRRQPRGYRGQVRTTRGRVRTRALAPPAGPVAEHHSELQVPAPALVLGLVLAVIAAAEIYIAVGVVALGSGRLLLGVGIALDACARGLGTLAAGRTGEEEWSWACAIGGSPFVAAFALFQPSGAVTTEPAPLAGLVAIVTCAMVALAVLVGA